MWSSIPQNFPLRYMIQLANPSKLFFISPNFSPCQSKRLSGFCRNKAPFKKIFAHGFALDEEGKKMSKSLGNVIHPDSVVNRHGADVLRLWVAHSAEMADIHFGPSVIDSIDGNATKWRNLFRFLLGCLDGFSAEENGLSRNELLLTDRHMLYLTEKLLNTADSFYKQMQYYQIVVAYSLFISTTVSSFYCEAIKDRMYCDAKDSTKRRSAQTTVKKVLEALITVIAPIMPFLSEEVFQHLEKPNPEVLSFFETQWPSISSQEYRSNETQKVFLPVIQMRQAFIDVYGNQNPAKLALALHVSDEVHESSAALTEKDGYSGCSEICDVFGVSDVQLLRLNQNSKPKDPGFCGDIVDESGKKSQFWGTVDFAKGRPCGRCRKYVIQDSTGDLCGRCLDVIGLGWNT